MLRKDGVTFLDLGAKDGVPDIWLQGYLKYFFGEVEIAAIDSESKNFFPGSVDCDLFRKTSISAVISRDHNIKDFYVYNRDSGSSLYPFDDKYSYLYDSDYHALAEVWRVETRTIESLVSSSDIQNAPSLIKLDIQGAELDALKGLGKYLSQVELVVTEFALLALYKNQPLFHDINTFLLANKLELVDMHLSKQLYTLHEGLPRPGRMHERLTWTPQVYGGDAIYVRSIDSALLLEYEDLVKHLCILSIYRLYDRLFYIASRSSHYAQLLKDNRYKLLINLSSKESFHFRLFKFIRKALLRLHISIPAIFDSYSPWLERNHPNV